MKICFLNHDLKDNTGSGRFGRQLIGNLTKAYSDVLPVVLTSVGSSNSIERVALPPNIFRLALTLPRIRSILKDCDLIHALDGFPYGVIACLAVMGLGKRIVITAVGTGAVQAFRHPIKRLLLRWVYKRANRVIAVSNHTKKEILKVVPGLDITVINHAVDISEFSEYREDDLSAAEKEEINRLKPYILSVGSGKLRKGYEYSFPAFVWAERRFPGLKYVTVGYDKKDMPVSSFDIADKAVCFVGIRRQFLRALYRNAELFMLLPYDYRGDIEGFGFVFLEAAAAGLPVVGTYNTGAEDAVSNGKNGFLVEPRNAQMAARAVLKILSDPALKKNMGKESVYFAESMNWNKVAEEYYMIYKKLEV